MIINRNKQKSFTLIELLVVLVIIGILAGVIMISTSSSIDKANIAKSKVFSESVKNNLMLNLMSEWTFDDVASYSENTSLTININSQLPTNTKIPDEWGSLVGTGVNGPVLRGGSDCVSGECLEFSRNNLTHVQIGDTHIISPSYTLEFFFKKSNASEYNCFTEGSDYWTGGYHFWSGGASFYNRIDLTDVSFNDDLFLSSNWNHLVVTVKANSSNRDWTLYFNGKNIHSTSIPLVTTHFSNLKIGYSSGNSSPLSYFNGKIDEFKVFKEALSSSQIKQNYIAGLNSMLSNGTISKQEYNERINTLAYDKE